MTKVVRGDKAAVIATGKPGAVAGRVSHDCVRGVRSELPWQRWAASPWQRGRDSEEVRVKDSEHGAGQIVIMGSCQEPFHHENTKKEPGAEEPHLLGSWLAQERLSRKEGGGVCGRPPRRGEKGSRPAGVFGEGRPWPRLVLDRGL